ALGTRIREALFQASAEQVTVGEAAPGSLRLSYSDGELEVVKDFTIPSHGYLVTVAVSVKRGGQDVPHRLVWGPGLRNPTPPEREVQGYQPAHATVLTSSVERFPTAKLPAEGRTLGGVQWAGLETQYFTAIFVPSAPGGSAAVRTYTLPPAEDG